MGLYVSRITDLLTHQKRDMDFSVVLTPHHVVLSVITYTRLAEGILFFSETLNGQSL
jgi:hypothetical protein